MLLVTQELVEDLAMNMHDLNGNAALPSGVSGDCARYHSDLAHDIAQSLSDSGVWSDELSLAGPVDSSDQKIIEYIGSLFEFARRQLGKPQQAEGSNGMKQIVESEPEVALSFVLEKTYEPNHQLFVALEREREHLSTTEEAMSAATETQQIYHMALFDACAEVVAAEIAAASEMHRKRQQWLGSVNQWADQDALASICLTQEMLTQRVLSNTKWQRKCTHWSCAPGIALVSCTGNRLQMH